MGWVNESEPDHEGLLVGLVEIDDLCGWKRYRELGYPDDKAKRDDVVMVQAGCTCGWRSARYQAPRGSHWFPYVVELGGDERAEAIEEVARAMWHLHLGTVRIDAEAMRTARVGGLALELARRRDRSVALRAAHPAIVRLAGAVYLDGLPPPPALAPTGSTYGCGTCEECAKDWGECRHPRAFVEPRGQ